MAPYPLIRSLANDHGVLHVVTGVCYHGHHGIRSYQDRLGWGEGKEGKSDKGGGGEKMLFVLNLSGDSDIMFILLSVCLSTK